MAYGPPFPKSDGYPVGEQLPPITSHDYRYEAERRKTFLGWSSNRISSEKLAHAGFIYTREGDKVKCFKCGVTRSRWQQRDIPFNAHQQLNPCCPFLQTFVCKRKPLRSEMVLCSNAPALQRKTRWNTHTPVHQLYRGTTLQLHHFSSAQSVVRSFPGCSPVDHNPTRGLVLEDDDTIHHPVMIPPVQPPPAQLPPPVQSTQSFDCSAVLIGDVSKPLQTHHAAGICKDPIHTKTNVTVDDNKHSMNNDDNELNHRMSQGNICRICTSAVIECIYLPCGHAGTCRSCVDEVKKNSTRCPFCNTVVISTPNIYFP